MPLFTEVAGALVYYRRLSLITVVQLEYYVLVIPMRLARNEGEMRLFTLFNSALSKGDLH